MLQRGVGGQDGVVRLYDGGCHLWSRVDRELQLTLFAVVDGEPLHEKGGESRAGPAPERVEDEETLQAGALLRLFSQTLWTIKINQCELNKSRKIEVNWHLLGNSNLEDEVDDLLADRVVPPCVVVGRVLLAGHKLLRVEERAVDSCSRFVDH